jgi:cobalt-zinc-cadmium resistance protein CzcA
MLQPLLRLSIEHRRVVVLLTLGAAAVGAFCLWTLPIDAVPDITGVQVQINAVAPSLSPVEIEKQVTFPIETALSGIPGLQRTRSLSRNGFSQVTAVFDDDVDVYFARVQVGERLAEARDSLAPGVEPRMGPVSTGLGEIYMWTVGFETPGAGGRARAGSAGWQEDGSYLTPEGEWLKTPLERAAYLRTVQDWVIRPQLRGVKGVAGVDSIGGYVKQYHVRPDPMQLVSFGLSFRDVIDALERNNVSIGAGYVERAGESYAVRAAGRIESIQEIEQIVVGTRGGTPIHVHDVAVVAIGSELSTGSASENGEEVVVGTALMRVGENSRAVASAVDRKMEEIRRTLPPGVRAKTVLDRTKLVRATIATVEKNLAEGAALVIVILFLLLGNLRAALICALAIPLSMLLAAIGMAKGRISGNLMSLGAIDFGLIVDGAVIVVENALRMLGERQHALARRLNLQERLETVLAASRQVLGSSAFGQAIIITVYLPILALTGIEGKMFRPMAITVILALVAAFVLSLTFVPAMVALVVGGRVRERENVLMRAARRAYEPALRFALRFRRSVVLAAVALFVASLGLARGLGQEFVPTLDEKDLAMQALRLPSCSLTQSQALQSELERAIARLPEVAFVFSKTGTADVATDPMPPNVSDTFLLLKPRDEWPDPELGKDALIARIERACASVPGNQLEFTQPIQMRFNELIAGVRGDVAVKVFGDDFATLDRAGEQIARVLRGVEGVADVKTEQLRGLPVMSVDVDRAAIARFGLSVADVQDVVAAAVGGRAAGLVFEGDRRFDLVVRLPDDLRREFAALESLPVPLPPDDSLRAAHAAERVGFVPLSSVATLSVEEGPNQVSRENGKRRAVVQANVRGRDLGSFVTEAQAQVARLALPAGTWLEWGGQYENLVAARARLVLVVPLCFVLIFVLLYSTFDSLRCALLVFSGVPLGLTGGIVALWLRAMPFSISAGVGFIALSGVAVLNGLVLVNFFRQLEQEGVPPEEAVVRGALTRLRPVLMTALVASLGFVPMALATGTGAEVQRPLASVVIGGLVSSTLLTLVVLPALYRIFAPTRPPSPPPHAPPARP